MFHRPTAVDIRPLGTADWSAGLELLHARQPDPTERILTDLGRLYAQPELAAGLWGCYRGGELAGVVWYEPQPGRAAYLHVPSFAPGREAGRELSAHTLLIAAERAVTQLGATWLQSLVDPTVAEPWLAGTLARWGFKQYSTLSYQVCPRSRFPTAAPRIRWLPRPVSADDETDLAQVVQSTYRGSLDCPEMDGQRSPYDVISGYALVGDSGRRYWSFAEQHDRPLGCLLLTRHPQLRTDQGVTRPNPAGCFAELIYWGIVPARRGEGLGQEIVQYGLWQAAAMGADKLVLAVDAANFPALKIYSRAGFWEWTRRTVWAKAATSTATTIAGSDPTRAGIA